MRKVLLICLVIFVLAITIDTPKIDITGLFIKATSVMVTIAKFIAKEIINIISSVL